MMTEIQKLLSEIEELREHIKDISLERDNLRRAFSDATQEITSLRVLVGKIMGTMA